MLDRCNFGLYASVLAVATVVALGTTDVSYAQSGLETRTIGILVPANLPSTESENSAIDLAVSDFNLQAVERGWILAIDIQNDNADPTTALEVVRAFDSKGLSTIVGPSTSVTMAGIYNYIHENNMLVVSYSSGALDLSISNDNIFHTTSDISTSADAYAALLKSDGIKNIVTIVLDDTFGASFENSIISAVNRDPTDALDVHASIRYSDAETDHVRVMAELESALASSDTADVAVIISDYAGGLVTIMESAAATLDPAPGMRWYGADHLLEEMVSNDTILPFLSRVDYKAVTTSMYENDLSIYIDSVVNDTSGLSYVIYDTIFILGNAIDEAGSATDTAAIKAALSRSADKHVSALGASAVLNANGDRAKSNYNILSLVDDRFVTTAQYDSANDVILEYSVPEVREIGALVSETGPLSVLGVGASKAISLAVADYNKQLRAEDADWRLGVTKLDDKANPARSLEQARVLYDGGIRSMVGPVSSSSIAAIQDFTSENGMLVLGYASSSPTLAVAGDNIFRMRASDKHTESTYGVILERHGIDNVIIVYRDDVWGSSLNNHMRNHVLDPATYNVLPCCSYPPGVTTDEIGALVDRIGDVVDATEDRSSVGILLYGFEELEAVPAFAAHHPSLQESRWYGYLSTLLYDSDTDGKEWLNKVGFYTLSPTHTPNPVSEYIDSQIQGTSIYTYHAYDAVFTLANAIRSTGSSTDTVGLASVMHDAASSVDSPAVGTPLAFDRYGDLAGASFVLLQYTDGGFTPVEHYSSGDLVLPEQRPQLKACR